MTIESTNSVVQPSSSEVEASPPLLLSYLPASNGTSGTAGTGSLLTRLLNGLQTKTMTVPDGTDGTGLPTLHEVIPSSFFLTKDGVALRTRKEDGYDLLCGPLIVFALTRGTGRKDFGMIIRGIALDDSLVELILPSVRLHGDAADFARQLADMGIRIVPGKEKKLAEYLDACRELATRRPWFTASPNLGWLPGENLSYLFPGGALGAERLVFQPYQLSRMKDRLAAAGSFEPARIS